MKTANIIPRYKLIPNPTNTMNSKPIIPSIPLKIFSNLLIAISSIVSILYSIAENKI